MGTSTRRILVADDHEVMRRGVKTVLESRPEWHVVAEAGDGQSAIALARETQPDIAILDYMLPMSNGLDLTRILKRELPRTEVLLYTMHDREELIVDVLRAGARGYVLKSDHAQHLLAAVDALAIHRPYFSSTISETLLGRILEAEAEPGSTTLTHREREVVQLIAEGKINKEIGHMLHISVKTVETHRAASMSKLQLRTTAELVRYAVRNNIVQA
ncbi:response regulator [Sphingomonas cavernae]|uniref:DNA-binding response regulator n=1 Tax=Sphingomonas cavernae TaxID=2320861 RepID=A0A418WNK7_9SPHN|nr:response regulator transcription factor [Sphingomonas cavernae]RJF91585.1 DNA-binding response regulator [Sphingomonas cavernae]